MVVQVCKFIKNSLNLTLRRILWYVNYTSIKLFLKIIYMLSVEKEIYTDKIFPVIYHPE